MTSDELRAALEVAVGPEHVERASGPTAARGPELARASTWMVHPGSAAEVAEVLLLANRVGLVVVPVGASGRAAQERAPAIDRARVLLDVERMNHVLHLDERSLVVHAQAGLTGTGLERVLGPRGLTLGDYPPRSLGSTLGSMVAARAPGRSSPRYGFFEDAVLGVSAVLADGRTVHTRVAPRRASGPDLARALCGTGGTIGVITAVVLRIHRRAEARFLAAHALPSFEDALAAVRLALREEAAPAALRVYDAAEAHAQLGAVCGDHQAVLVVATAGPTDLAACDRDLVASAASALGGERLADAVAEAWWRQRIDDGGAAPVPPPSLEVTAPPGAQAPVYRAVRAACEAAGVRARAHASRFEADGAIETFTFTDAAGAPLEAAALDDIVAAAARAAEKAGGLLRDSEQPGLGTYEVELARRLDPRDILAGTR